MPYDLETTSKMVIHSFKSGTTVVIFRTVIHVVGDKGHVLEYEFSWIEQGFIFISLKGITALHGKVFVYHLKIVSYSDGIWQLKPKYYLESIKTKIQEKIVTTDKIANTFSGDQMLYSNDKINQVSQNSNNYLAIIIM